MRSSSAPPCAIPDTDALRSLRGRGRSSFRVVLTPRRPGRVRWIELGAQSRDRPGRYKQTLVRVSA